MEETVIQLRDVSKHFGHYQALSHVTMAVKRGDIYALIGENGAGKTTLMRLILGLSPTPSGEVMVLGEHAGHYRHALSRVGAIIEAPAAFSKLTVRQNLEVIAIQHGLNDPQAITDAIQFVGLTAKVRTQAKHLSLGQRQRLGLATAILAHPDLLILDEPINGLDPTGIVEFRTLLQRLNQEQQTTILISSHILTELYQVATQFGFLHHGTLIQTLSKPALDAANQAGLVVTVSDVNAAASLLDAQQIKQFKVLNERDLLVAAGQIEPAALNRLLVDHQLEVMSIAMKEGSLEDYYTDLIAHSQEGRA
ncbi:ABC transporter ATP-binding protein [Lacticaseibacillus absianus]|uniref:ABC transporter ATP-binding protein n=1 Tax=Lacticaseibacillus absianus TaxID=2729623 RepID=UPI0015C7283B|nr:ATP-binding cassette domain-containing protein [Lacticaseibacillus absianus]